MPTRVAVVGAGSWGTAVAAICARNAPTTLWARRPELADEVNRDHTNLTYLPNFALPEKLRGTASLEEAMDGADVVVMAVPSHGFRAVLEGGSGFLAPGAAIVYGHARCVRLTSAHDASPSGGSAAKGRRRSGFCENIIRGCRWC